MTVHVLRILSDPAHRARWQSLPAADLRRDIDTTLGFSNIEVLVERIVLWLRPLRRRKVPTKFQPLEVAIDRVDVTSILDVTSDYPNWIRRHPKAISEWDWERNSLTRDPWSGIGVSQKAWWICDDGHSWEASPQVRGAAATNCPYCIGRFFWPGHTDLGTLRPDIAAQWNTAPGANRGDPHHVSATSARNISWRCDRGHTWPARVSQRTKQGSNCPYCAGRRAIAGETDLATLRPDLLLEWDFERNGDSITPETVGPGSTHIAWWHGSCDHCWDAAISDRCAGTGCPYCSNRRALAGYNDLATTHPQLAHEWDGANAKGPHEVTAGSVYRAVWRCAFDHTWEVAVWGRTADKTGCPYCAGKRPIRGENDLATVRPDLAVQWDPANALSPDEVSAGSSRTVSWRCSEGHTWRSRIGKRTSRPHAHCTECRRRGTTSLDGVPVRVHRRRQRRPPIA
ncbi:zinc-ribbon domain-containing protein [Microbacterium sp. NPDC088619]|uniref:zinc-ribbon domain-containing protein n=1 Tax=Microbacterium sp. NPDC088619 TaxID=3364196 RepID=UPI00382D30F6